MTINPSVKRGIIRAYNQGVDIESISRMFSISLHNIIDIVHSNLVSK